jgi:hypothetical protein
VRKFPTGARSIVVVAMLGLVLMLGMPSVALASGYAVSHFGTVCFRDFCVPSGVFEHEVAGNDRIIDSQWAEVETPATICDWKIDFVFLDAQGGEYFRSPGETNNTCVLRGYREHFPEPLAKQWEYGQTCAELTSNGEFIARTCLDIVRPSA